MAKQILGDVGEDGATGVVGHRGGFSGRVHESFERGFEQHPINAVHQFELEGDLNEGAGIEDALIVVLDAGEGFLGHPLAVVEAYQGLEDRGHARHAHGVLHQDGERHGLAVGGGGGGGAGVDAVKAVFSGAVERDVGAGEDLLRAVH